MINSDKYRERKYYSHEDIYSKLNEEYYPRCDYVEVSKCTLGKAYSLKGVEVPNEISDNLIIFDQGGYAYTLDVSGNEQSVYFVQYNSDGDWSYEKIFESLSLFVSYLEEVEPKGCFVIEEDKRLYEVRLNDRLEGKSPPKYWNEILSGHTVKVYGLVGALLQTLYVSVEFVGSSPKYAKKVNELTDKECREVLHEVKKDSARMLKEARKLKELASQFNKPMPEWDALVLSQGFGSPQNEAVSAYIGDAVAKN